VNESRARGVSCGQWWDLLFITAKYSF